MKKLFLVLMLIILAISTTAVFAAPLNANRIVGGNIYQDDWGYAFGWDRNTAGGICVPIYPPGGHTGQGALQVYGSTSKLTTGYYSCLKHYNSWPDVLRYEINPGATYTLSVWMNWDLCSTANGVGVLVTIFDGSEPQNGTPYYAIEYGYVGYLNYGDTTNVIGTYLLATTGSSNGNWVQLTGTFAVPANGRSVSVIYGTFNTNDGAWAQFNELSLRTENDPNLLVNAGFEWPGSSGVYPTYWRNNTDSNHASWTLDTYNSGTSCVYVQQSTDFGYRMWYNTPGINAPGVVVVEQGKSYLYGGWMKWSNVTTGSVGIGVQWIDKNGNTLNNDSAEGTGYNANVYQQLVLPPNTSVTATGNNATWTYLVATATPPTGAVVARVNLWNYSTIAQPANGAAIAWYDDVVFKDLLPEVSVSPLSATMHIGDTRTFVASGGTPPYTWTSSSTAVGSIDSTTGFFTANALGTTTITATDAEGIAGTATVTVTATKAPFASETPAGYLHRSELFDIEF